MPRNRLGGLAGTNFSLQPAVGGYWRAVKWSSRGCDVDHLLAGPTALIPANGAFGLARAHMSRLEKQGSRQAGEGGEGGGGPSIKVWTFNIWKLLLHWTATCQVFEPRVCVHCWRIRTRDRWIVTVNRLAGWPNSLEGVQAHTHRERQDDSTKI
jgi:hypothetical protein